jgi:hypothetical protein
MHLDALTLFGLAAVSAMLLFYALEHRSHWYVLAFAETCALASAYGFLQGAWPFGLVEAVWTVVTLRRWFARRFSWRPARFVLCVSGRNRAAAPPILVLIGSSGALCLLSLSRGVLWRVPV